MHRSSAVCALLLCSASTARASESPPPTGASKGFEAGLRVGLELPVGDIDSGNDLRPASLPGVVQYRIPLWLDLGYRWDAAWWVGLGAQVGSGGFGDSCPASAECNWTDVRVLGQLQYRLAPHSPIDPWLGVALGWESLRGTITQKVEIEGNEFAVKVREVRGGPQLLLQGGLQFETERGLGIGPYATAALGRYVTESFDCPEEFSCGDEASGGRLHAWFGLGIRGSYGP